MTNDSMTNDFKALVKILIGAAWLDGKIQPEERHYLHRVAQEKGVADDPEIQPLLHELRSVTPDECYQWVQAYLGDHPTSEACQSLIEVISGLVYSDGAIADEEAKLLTRLQLVDAQSDALNSMHARILAAIRKLYQRGASQIS
ncbi:TerB family tellurite resistance protein [Myxacorys almedinensis]|uniref:TerB family tellurite resistance protein n=1 Tax=Myxacorys almedinensis A TaxID=2690445 RepID=A0A8J7Z293_9CYAN|nr:TerB family tellurite resistance protein [Myxacorys almedinensis]NDJ18712.1 TerB family tellurite resistance protein [Myxacorys almedinensis A]